MAHRMLRCPLCGNEMAEGTEYHLGGYFALAVMEKGPVCWDCHEEIAEAVRHVHPDEIALLQALQAGAAAEAAERIRARRGKP